MPHYLPQPYLDTPKDIGTKSGETTYGTELYHYANFHVDRREISVPRQKYIFFLIGNSPVGVLSI